MEVTYVISIDRKDRLKEVKMSIWLHGKEQPLEIFEFGELGSLSFSMSKKVIISGYSIQEFDKNPKDDQIHISVSHFSII